MKRNEIVQKLRELARETEGQTEMLPTIFKDIAEGHGSQSDWSRIEVSPIFTYIADMIQE